MIKIGLTDTGTEWKHLNYVRWIKAAACKGASIGSRVDEVDVVRLSAALGNLNEMAGCHGLVLSGGIDIDPSLYGGAGDYKRSPASGWEKERDLFEQAVLRMAWERDLPVLGVCRGLQLINITLRGTLVQDLGIAGDAVHEANAGIDKAHPVRVEAGSLLAEVTGHLFGEVNSAHHQAVGRLGEGLSANCYAADGTIEGIEWTQPEGRPFLLAVQWHPERMLANNFSDTYLYRAIGERFMEEVKKTTQE
jgi:putative glutamine amidotransferase